MVAMNAARDESTGDWARTVAAAPAKSKMMIARMSNRPRLNRPANLATTRASGYDHQECYVPPGTTGHTDDGSSGCLRIEPINNRRGSFVRRIGTSHPSNVDSWK